MCLVVFHETILLIAAAAPRRDIVPEAATLRLARERIYM